MPPDSNTTQNQDSAENPLPTSPQEPTEHASENTAHSEPVDALPEAPEATGSDFEVKSTDIPPSNSIPTEQGNEQKTEERQAENEPKTEPVSEPAEAPEPETAQIPVNEPLEETKAEVKNPEPEPGRKGGEKRCQEPFFMTTLKTYSIMCIKPNI